MSQVVLDAIAREVAKLSKVVDTPSGPLGYGTDLSCSEDLTETMDEVGGLSPRVLSEAIVRRLTTPRGTLPDVRAPGLVDMDYGLDVTAFLNRGLTDAEVRSLGSNIRSEVTKDDRISSVTPLVTPLLSPSGSSLKIELQVTPRDPSVEPFSLVLSATSEALLIEEISSGGGR